MNESGKEQISYRPFSEGPGRIMNKSNYTFIENYMNACMEDRAHDNQHIYRVLYNALRIAQKEKAAAVAFYNSLYDEVKSSYENGKEELEKILEQD